MDLVVARHQFAGRRVDEAAVVDAVVDAGVEGHRAADEPEPEPPRCRREEILDRPVPRPLAGGELVGVAQSQDAEVLGQHGQLRTTGGSLFGERAGNDEIGRDVRAGDGLEGGDAEGFRGGVGHGMRADGGGVEFRRAVGDRGDRKYP